MTHHIPGAFAAELQRLINQATTVTQLETACAHIGKGVEEGHLTPRAATNLNTHASQRYLDITGDTDG